MRHRIFTLSIMIALCSITDLYSIQAQDELERLQNTLQKAGSEGEKVRIMVDITWYYLETSSDSSLVYAKRALKTAEAAHNDDYIISALNALYAAYIVFDDYENALKYNLMGYRLLHKNHLVKNYAANYGNIGFNYLKLKEYKKAHEYFDLALKNSKYSTDSVQPIQTLFNIAQSYIAQNKFAEARECNEKALAESKKIGCTECIRRIYENLGDLHLETKDYKKSLYYYREAFHLCDVNNNYEKAICLYGMAGNYLGLRNYYPGIEYAMKADSLAKSGNFLDVIKGANLILSQLYDSMQKPTIAYEYYKQYIIYKDSIFNIEKNKRISFLHTEFETRQKEERITALQKETTMRKKIIYAWAIVSVMFLVVLFFIIRGIMQKNKRLKYEKELIESRLANEKAKVLIEKERLSQQKEKEHLEKQKMELELDEKHREILTHTLQINQQKEVLTSVQSEITNIMKNPEPESIIRSVKQLGSDIKNRIDLSDDWQQIKMHFEKVHPDFFEHLKKTFPDLTMHELKICAYTKLKFNTKEIGRLLNISAKSVIMSRYRLKKKMKIHEETGFEDFINTQH